MRKLFNQLILTCASMATSALPSALYAELITTTVSNDVSVANYNFPPPVPIIASDSSVLTADSISAVVSGASAVDTFSLSSLIFDWNYTQSTEGPASSNSQITSFVKFHVDSSTPYALTSTWDGLATSGIPLYSAVLFDFTDSNVIFDDEQAALNHDGILMLDHVYQFTLSASLNNFTTNESLIGGSASTSVKLSITPIPEPSTIALVGLGGIGLAIGAYRRRRAAAI